MSPARSPEGAQVPIGGTARSAKGASLTRRHLLLMGAAAAGGTLTVARAQAPREIEITAQRFKFTPNVIPLKAGEPVVLLIRSLDFAHGFFVPDLKLRTDLMPGRVVRLALTPREPGELAFLCDNFCGDGHEGMDGHFQVT
jgi:cytochrome c oxidase subunit II